MGKVLRALIEGRNSTPKKNGCGVETPNKKNNVRSPAPPQSGNVGSQTFPRNSHPHVAQSQSSPTGTIDTEASNGDESRCDTTESRHCDSSNRKSHHGDVQSSDKLSPELLNVLNDLTKRLYSIEKDNVQLNEEVSRLNEKVSNLQTDKHDLLEEVTTLKEKLSEAQNDRDELRQEVTTLNEKVSEFEEAQRRWQLQIDYWIGLIKEKVEWNKYLEQQLGELGSWKQQAKYMLWELMEWKKLVTQGEFVKLFEKMILQNLRNRYGFLFHRKFKCLRLDVLQALIDEHNKWQETPNPNARDGFLLKDIKVLVPAFQAFRNSRNDSCHRIIDGHKTEAKAEIVQHICKLAPHDAERLAEVFGTVLTGEKIDSPVNAQRDHFFANFLNS